MGCNFSQFLEETTTSNGTTSTTTQDHKVEQHSIVATPSEISTVYATLPSGSEKHSVHHVYDGDTLTLSNQTRVRFLGIDTPELKEKQPFAKEAKEFTLNLCQGKDVWLSFEAGNKEDHYGRLLAFVWVPTMNGKKGYVCVNEAIVAAGLATVYVPNASSKLHNKDKMLALQKQARLQRKGMWSTFQDSLVFKSENGVAYHVRSCKHMAKVKRLTELRASEAADLGLHPCRTCMS